MVDEISPTFFFFLSNLNVVLYLLFFEKSQNVIGGVGDCGILIICLKIGLFNFSQCVWCFFSYLFLMVWVYYYHYHKEYFNLGSEAVLWCILSDWAPVQRRQQDDVDNMKVMSRNTSSPLHLAYPNNCSGSWAGAKHSHITKNFSPLHLLTGIAILLIGFAQAKPANKGKLASV